MSIQAYAAMNPKSGLVDFRYEPAVLGPWDVEVRITHCGLCHSDIHLIDNDWQVSRYPLVPGHEIIGVVRRLGGEASHLKEGQRVGVGWQRGACLQCDYCVSGRDNLCAQHQATCVGHHGGFAETILLDSRFAFSIPDALDSENAAPLLCGGVTVYSPMRHYGVTPPMRVGVVGVGGLGHLALQFARAIGCEVIAFSSSAAKASEALGFGAHRFVDTANDGDMRKSAGSLDFILSTVPVDLNWMMYLGLLRPNGKLCFVGVAPGNISIPAGALINGQKCVCGSAIGSRAVMREMLAFAERHRIVAKTELLPMSEVNQAIAQVRSNRARYRMVLKNPAEDAGGAC